jgi:hypothetical protein
MCVEETILGFDSREMWTKFAGSWLEQHRSRYLLRYDLTKPLSVSTRVWALAYDDVSQETKSSDWRASLGLWDNLSNLQEHMRRLGEDRLYWLVAITLLIGILTEQEIEEEWSAFLPTTIPDILNSDWLLLGYDVATGGLLSGLSCCGYKPEVAPLLRSQWGPCLNEYHLFADRQDAIDFVEVSNNRVREHAPFDVFGLYLIGSSC